MSRSHNAGRMNTHVLSKNVVNYFTIRIILTKYILTYWQLMQGENTLTRRERFCPSGRESFLAMEEKNTLSIAYTGYKYGRVKSSKGMYTKSLYSWDKNSSFVLLNMVDIIHPTQPSFKSIFSLVQTISNSDLKFVQFTLF